MRRAQWSSYSTIRTKQNVVANESWRTRLVIVRCRTAKDSQGRRAGFLLASFALLLCELCGTWRLCANPNFKHLIIVARAKTPKLAKKPAPFLPTVLRL